LRLRSKSLCIYQPFQLDFGCDPCPIQISMLAPTYYFCRSFPLNDAVIHLRIEPLIAAKVGVEGALLKALVLNYVRRIGV